jgi:hypothetical protein
VPRQCARSTPQSTLSAEHCQVSVRADGSVSLLYLDRDAFNRCVRTVASQRLRSPTACREMQRTTGRAGLTIRCSFQQQHTDVPCSVCGSLMNILSRNMATYNSHAKRAELPLSVRSRKPARVRL